MTKAPPLKNDCFALPPGAEWTAVDDALDTLRKRLHPVSATQNVPLADLLGRVLAEPVIAQRAHPPLPNSAVDGYGFAGALDNGEHQFPLVAGRAAAGAPFERTVPEGAAIRILTGAALPKGVTTVVLQEDVNVSDGSIHVNGPVKSGANARQAGEDVKHGEHVLPPGHQIRPQDIGLLASVGVARASTVRPLRVAVVSTGDELAEPATDAASGTIFDANRPMLLALLRKWGIETVDLGIQADNRADVCAALDRGAMQADVILTSGGASAGDEDHISAALNENGSMALWRVAIKPGRPLALGVWNGTPVFGLPGNPVAAFVCSLIFVRPALRLLGGQTFVQPEGRMVPAAFSKKKKPGRREYLRARLTEKGAEVFASEGSGRISGLSWANGLVELPDGAIDVEPGTPVKFLSYAEFGL